MNQTNLEKLIRETLLQLVAKKLRRARGPVKDLDLAKRVLRRLSLMGPRVNG